MTYQPFSHTMKVKEVGRSRKFSLELALVKERPCGSLGISLIEGLHGVCLTTFVCVMHSFIPSNLATLMCREILRSQNVT